MTSKLDMQEMRYLNLFARITNVNTRYFFRYNNMLVFCVPQNLVAKSLGKNAENLRKMSSILGKRIRVVAQPQSIKDAKRFIRAVINPVNFQNLEIKENKIIISAGKISKSSLIGREKARLMEMQTIIKDFFKKDFEIV